jgi:hypothetical protein
VRNSEARDIEIADRKSAAGLERFDARGAFAPVDRRGRLVSQINGNAELLRHRGQAADMIGVLVRDQNRSQVLYLFANRGQTLRYLSPAQPHIHKHPRTVRRKEHGISGTAAREYANFDDGLTPALRFAKDVSFVRTASLRYTTQ